MSRQAALNTRINQVQPLDKTLAINDLTTEERTRVERELDPDEQILWLGRPDARRMLRSVRVWRISCFGLMTLGIAAICGSFFWNAPEPGWYIIGFVMLVAGGVAARVHLQIYRRVRSSVYLLTDQRAVFMWEDKRTLMVRTLDRSFFHSVRRVERTDGCGDLIFEQSTSFLIDDAETSFSDIPDVKHVHDLVRKLVARGDDSEA